MSTTNRSQRKSLPLTAHDLADLATMRTSVEHREALSGLANRELTEASSEAILLQAVMEAGFRAVSEQVEEAGYARIAAESEASESKKIARRRRPSWADE